jgi:hypothetical protein
MDVIPVIWFLNPDFATMVDTFQWKIVAHAPLLASLDFHFGVSVHDVDDTAPYPAFTCE